MAFSARTLALTALLVLGLAGAPAIAATTPTVRDNAGLFSQDAIAQAERIMQRIERDYKHDVVVKTYNTLQGVAPDASQGEVNRWAKRRFVDLHDNGLLIVICKKPHKFSVQVGNETQKVFHQKDLEAVESLLVRNLRDHPDRALVESVKEIETAFETNWPRGQARPAPRAAQGRRRMGPGRLDLHWAGRAAGDLAGVRADPCRQRRLRRRWLRRRRLWRRRWRRLPVFDAGRHVWRCCRHVDVRFLLRPRHSFRPGFGLHQHFRSGAGAGHQFLRRWRRLGRWR